MLLSESVESLGLPFSKGVIDLSSPRVNMTESVSVMELLVSPFLEGEAELRRIVMFLKVLREERSESLTEGTGEGATGIPLCSRRRWRAAYRSSTSPPTVFKRTFSSRSFILASLSFLSSSCRVELEVLKPWISLWKLLTSM